VPAALPDLTHEPIVEDDAVARLLQLRAQVARADEDVLGELLALFERDSADRIVTMKRAVREADHEGLSRAAHALKGSAANLGARRVFILAHHCERAAGQIDLAGVDTLAAAVRDAVRVLRERLA
jgi:HPt (histidine-containing phosphotransfer) domain-containing protein